MRDPHRKTVLNDDVVRGMDAVHARIGRAHLDLLRLIAVADRREQWHDAGARDMAHWLWMRYGISHWKASRWIAAAHALESLPRVSAALASGELGIDKVVELTRLATPETEARLVAWAVGVSCGAIRRKGDLAQRQPVDDARDADAERRLTWTYSEDGRRIEINADLPAAQGAVVVRTIDRLADDLPVMPGEEGDWSIDARRADALVALASARIARDPDPDRATIVLHASVESLSSSDAACELEGGGIVHAEVARRLACSGRVQTVVEDAAGRVVHVGRMLREPPAWMMRQLRFRDSGCTFPGCGTKRFTHAHHIVWWEKGGTTDLHNLLLVCSFHHKLVHEYGWSVHRDPNGAVSWFGPEGTCYRAGPAPPRMELPGRAPPTNATRHTVSFTA